MPAPAFARRNRAGPIFLTCPTMPFHHERRRRFLADESLDAASGTTDDLPIRLAAEPAGRTDAGAAAYAAAARFDRERRVLDLVPARPLMVALLLVIGLFHVGLAVLLHVGAGSLTTVLDPEEVAALRLDTARNFSHWLSSMLLGFCSLVAVLIYRLRRHRVDDYYGRYRVWLWTALGCLLASLAETTDVAPLARGLCRKIAEFGSLSAAVVWPATWAVVLITAGIRLSVEVRRCKTAIALLVFSVGCFLLAAAVEQGWPAALADEGRPLLHRGSWLVGYVCVLATFLVYARHVLLELDGRVAPAAAKRKRLKSKPTAEAAPAKPLTEPAAKPALHLRTDLDPVESRSAAAGSVRPSANPSASKSATSQSTSPLARNDANDRGLSRAERRRLRRESRMAG